MEGTNGIRSDNRRHERRGLTHEEEEEGRMAEPEYSCLTVSHVKGTEEVEPHGPCVACGTASEQAADDTTVKGSFLDSILSFSRGLDSLSLFRPTDHRRVVQASTVMSTARYRWQMMSKEQHLLFPREMTGRRLSSPKYSIGLGQRFRLQCHPNRYAWKLQPDVQVFPWT